MNLEIVFSGKYCDLREHKQQTAKQSGFHLVNVAVDVSLVEKLTALDHLALVATGNR